MIVKVDVVRAGGRIPTYSTRGAACADLYAPETVHLTAGGVVKIDLAIALEIPNGYEGLIRGRSSAWDRGWIVVHGTVDSDYRGEIGIQLLPHRATWIEKGDRIGQLAISPVARASFMISDSLSPTDRGTGGWGSTGR